MITTNRMSKFPENPTKKLRIFTTNKIRDAQKDKQIGELRGPTLYHGKIIQAGYPLIDDTRADVKRITSAEIHAKIQAAAHPTRADVKKRTIITPFKDDVPGAPVAADPALAHQESVPEVVPEPMRPEDLTAPPPPAEPFVAAPDSVVVKKKFSTVRIARKDAKKIKAAPEIIQIRNRKAKKS